MLTHQELDGECTSGTRRVGRQY